MTSNNFSSIFLMEIRSQLNSLLEQLKIINLVDSTKKCNGYKLIEVDFWSFISSLRYGPNPE